MKMNGYVYERADCLSVFAFFAVSMILKRCGSYIPRLTEQKHLTKAGSIRMVK